MGTEVIQIDPQAGSDEVVRRAAAVLEAGGLVVFPTETVYGVGACVSSPSAVKRLRTLKARTPDRAFTVHVGSRDAAARFIPHPNALADRFMRKAWPGPLTVIVSVDNPASAPAMNNLNGQAAKALYFEKTIGLRCPDNPVAEGILRAVQTPVVAASANKLGNPPPTTVRDVPREFKDEVDLLIDAGPTRYAKPSSIVRVSDASYELVREGVYDARVLERLSVLRILFVCTGNTCRSPMAAGLARSLLAKRLGCTPSELADHRVEVTSAGTAGGYGSAADHAVTVLANRDIDISQHVSAPLMHEHVHQSDHIFAMTSAHRDAVVNLVPSASDRVTLLLDGEDLNDPIGGSEEEYEACAARIEEGVRARLQEVLL